LKTIYQFLAALLMLASCAPGHRAVRQQTSSRSAANAGPVSVLFVGNSYSFEVPKQLRRIAAGNGRKLRVAQVTHGGWSLAQHVEDGGALHEIREGGWDVVVIQEQSRIPAVPARRTREMIPNVRVLAREARAAGAVPVLYQTWGRRDGDAHYSAGDDFMAMNRRLRDGYREAARAAGGLTIVPVGDAWEREVSAGRRDELFQADGSHPTPRGNRLAAETFYEALFSGKQL